MSSSLLSPRLVSLTVQSLYHKNALTELNQTMSLILVARAERYRRLMLAGHSVIYTRQKQSFSFRCKWCFIDVCIKYKVCIIIKIIIWEKETKCFKYFHLIIFKLTTTFWQESWGERYYLHLCMTSRGSSQLLWPDSPCTPEFWSWLLFLCESWSWWPPGTAWDRGDRC